MDKRIAEDEGGPAPKRREGRQRGGRRPKTLGNFVFLLILRILKNGK
jgi:hypothetical protein